MVLICLMSCFLGKRKNHILWYKVHFVSITRDEPFTSSQGANPPSTEAAMMHHHVSTGTQNGQKHVFVLNEWLSRMHQLEERRRIKDFCLQINLY